MFYMVKDETKRNANRGGNMDSKNIEITHDEAEDIRFALACIADGNESKAASCQKGGALELSLLEQASRLRNLAKKVSA
jgi:hypothetical protein